jgi:hypothetical protein
VDGEDEEEDDVNVSPDGAGLGVGVGAAIEVVVVFPPLSLPSPPFLDSSTPPLPPLEMVVPAVVIGSAVTTVTVEGHKGRVRERASFSSPKRLSSSESSPWHGRLALSRLEMVRGEQDDVHKTPLLLLLLLPPVVPLPLPLGDAIRL